MTYEEIRAYEARGLKIMFEGVSKSGDDWLVVGDSKSAFVMRNQGDHDKRFFIVTLCETEKALAKAQYYTNR